MPERYVEIIWPDGEQETCYSPSSVIEQYLISGQRYRLPEFLAIANKSLSAASERVRKKYGYACSSAMDQLKKINNKATQYKEADGLYVVVVRIR